VELEISKEDLDAVTQHGRRDYPNEACGVLVGHMLEPHRARVTKVIPCQNIRAGSLPRRYEIAPADLFRITRECRQNSTEIVGFYHSHPNCSSHYSTTDLAEAHWIGCFYLITSSYEDCAGNTEVFQLVGREDQKRFEDAALHLCD
jgi:proteasome lid subunit RPN8/RPN11